MKDFTVVVEMIWTADWVIHAYEPEPTDAAENHMQIFAS